MAEWSADIAIDAERAASIVWGRFPELRRFSVHPAGEGWDNALFRVGPELVFRMPRRRIGAELLNLLRYGLAVSDRAMAETGRFALRQAAAI